MKHEHYRVKAMPLKQALEVIVRERCALESVALQAKDDVKRMLCTMEFIRALKVAEAALKGVR